MGPSLLSRPQISEVADVGHRPDRDRIARELGVLRTDREAESVPRFRGQIHLPAIHLRVRQVLLIELKGVRRLDIEVEATHNREAEGQRASNVGAEADPSMVVLVADGDVLDESPKRSDRPASADLNRLGRLKCELNIVASRAPKSIAQIEGVISGVQLIVELADRRAQPIFESHFAVDLVLLTTVTIGPLGIQTGKRENVDRQLAAGNGEDILRHGASRDQQRRILVDVFTHDSERGGAGAVGERRCCGSDARQERRRKQSCNEHGAHGAALSLPELRENGHALRTPSAVHYSTQIKCLSSSVIRCTI